MTILAVFGTLASKANTDKNRHRIRQLRTGIAWTSKAVWRWL